MKQKFSTDNLNHHLWNNNNGIWFIQYTVYPTHNTKERIRRSLGTRCVKSARRYRDEILASVLTVKF